MAHFGHNCTFQVRFSHLGKQTSVVPSGQHPGDRPASLRGHSGSSPKGHSDADDWEKANMTPSCGLGKEEDPEQYRTVGLTSSTPGR